MKGAVTAAPSNGWPRFRQEKIGRVTIGEHVSWAEKGDSSGNHLSRGRRSKIFHIDSVRSDMSPHLTSKRPQSFRVANGGHYIEIKLRREPSLNVFNEFGLVFDISSHKPARNVFAPEAQQFGFQIVVGAGRRDRGNPIEPAV